MGLMDLRLPGQSGGSQVKRERGRRYNRDIEVACQVVDDIFDEIALSMKDGNISLLAKGFIQSLVLNGRTQDGVKEFIQGWSDERAKALMDKIEKRMDNRKK